MKKHPAPTVCCVFAFTLVLGCTGERPTSAQTSTVVASPELKSEIALIDSQIKQASDESAKYSGGLVKALIDSRLATLKQTRAMLEQRRAAGDNRILVNYTVNGVPFTPPATAQADVVAIEQELAASSEKIAAAERNAARYTGGLVQAMALSTLATMRQTHAMLEQKRVALKYGLPQYIGFAERQGPTVPPDRSAPSIDSAQSPKVAQAWEIVDVDARVTERNDTWWKYAWKLTLRNKGAADVPLRVTIEFQDAEGFVVEDDSQAVTLPAASEQTFTGYDLVTASVAGRIAKTNAKVAERGF